MRSVCPLAVAGVLLAGALHAAELAPLSQYEGKPIEQVLFSPESQPIVRADRDRLVRLRPGQPLRLADIRATIKQLYRTGEYANIEIDAADASQGVSLVIRTTEQFFVGSVEVHGKESAPPDLGQLANASRLSLGNPFSDEDLQHALTNIRNLFQRNGLYLATIDPKVERDPEHEQISFTFQVHPGKRARYTEPVIQGDTRIPVPQVAKAAKYKGIIHWKQVTQANTQAGVENIRRKYAKQERLTASVSLDRTDYIKEQNRVRPTISATGGPKVEVKTSGAKVSKSKLQEYVPVFDEGTVNRDLLVSGVSNLRDYFQNRGYFDVKVDFKTTNVDPDHERIQYVIGLGERHKVVRVDLQGNHYFTTTDLREHMFIQPKGIILLRHGRYSDGFAKRDVDALEALYKDNGFRDVKVVITPLDDYRDKKGDVLVNVIINEGAQYRVASVSLNGITHLDKSFVTSKLASGPGQPFSETNVSLDRTFILNQYHDAAYPDAGFDWRMAPGPGTHEVTLQYFITEGLPRYVRDVLFSGLHNTRRSLLNRSIALQPGDPLSWTDMGLMQRRLYNLGVFDRVDMAIQNPNGDIERKYVLFHLTEGHRYYVGVGFGGELARIGGSQTSLNNPGGATGFAPRADLEISRYNMFGLGHSLDFKSRYSTLDRRVSLTYSVPHYRDVQGRNITITGLYDNERDVLTFIGRRLEGSAQLSKQVSKSETALFRYTWRDVQVDQGSLKINPLLIPLTAQPARLGILSTTFIQDRRDDPINAHRGIYNSLDLGVVEHYFGGNKNFIRFLGRNSYYKRITGDVVVASNTEFGWIHPFSVTPGVDPFDYVPLPERFFGGGSTSHRGFPDNQAGPRDPTTGFPVGGNGLLFHSTELRFPLMGANIDGVLFHDMGNVYSSVSAISFRTHQNNLTDFDYMVHAAGFGIRYRTPVGPIRIDLAYSINPPTFNGLQGTYQQLLFNTATPAVQRVSHFQFFFSIGQAF
ncbi:MAG TPA: POTRA domain-containing protein [Bryobacteraceae bacterium]|nr:POTRA domain-containing protein [Bryobacteraceae bacterium]